MKNLAEKLQKVVENEVENDNFNDAIYNVQTAIGQNDGGTAGIMTAGLNTRYILLLHLEVIK